MSAFDIALCVFLAVAIGWIWVTSYRDWKKVYRDE